MASREYTPLVAFDDLPGRLPEGSVPEDVDTSQAAEEAVRLLNSFQKDDLHSDVIWRDLLSLTGYFRTFIGPLDASQALHNLSKQRSRSSFCLKDAKPRIAKSGPSCSWLDVDVLFSTHHGDLEASCMGTVSIISSGSGDWRIWMLRTWLECFESHGNPDKPRPGVQSGEANGTTNGYHSEELDAVVIGGGQAGLSTAGRLHALGLRYVLLERYPEIGDTWNNRYDSLRWHTSKDYGVLPFGPTFPMEDDYQLPAKRIAAGHKAWVEKYGINVRTNSPVESARWDNNANSWTITVGGNNTTIKAKNLVLCIGPGHGKPVYPSWATEDRIRESGFQGSIMHSFGGYRSAKEGPVNMAW